jgi:hypothetical protein
LINLPGDAVLGYYLRLITSNPKSWRRLLHGRAKLPRLLPRRRRKLPAEQRMGRARDFFPGAVALADRGVEMLLAHCEWDRGHHYYHRTHRSRLEQPALRERVVLETIEGANHEFSSLASQQRLIEVLERWSGRLERRPEHAG